MSETTGAIRSWRDSFLNDILKKHCLSEYMFCDLLCKTINPSDVCNINHFMQIQLLLAGKKEPANDERAALYAISEYFDSSITCLRPDPAEETKHIKKLQERIVDLLEHRSTLVDDLQRFRTDLYGNYTNSIETLLPLLEAHPELTRVIGLDKFLALLEKHQLAAKISPSPAGLADALLKRLIEELRAGKTPKHTGLVMNFLTLLEEIKRWFQANEISDGPMPPKPASLKEKKPDKRAQKRLIAQLEKQNLVIATGPKTYQTALRLTRALTACLEEFNREKKVFKNPHLLNSLQALSQQMRKIQARHFKT